MALSINLSGLNIPRSVAPTTRGASTRTAAASAARGGTSASKRAVGGGIGAAASTAKGAVASGARPATGAARPTGTTGVSRYNRADLPADLGPEQGVIEAPRPQRTPEQIAADVTRKTGYERTSGEALGLGRNAGQGTTLGRPQGNGRSFALETLAGQMAARGRGQQQLRRRGRRPGEFSL